jgi:hypothetical protein
MHQKIVKKLESEIQEAITEVIIKMGLKRLPPQPSHQTMPLMLKAAVNDWRDGCPEGSSATQLVLGSAEPSLPL